MGFDLELAIRESNEIECVPNTGFGIIDHIEAGRYMLACVRQGRLAEPKPLHHLLFMNTPLPGIGPGEYRDVRVSVGEHIPPAPALVPALMSNWLLDYTKESAKTPWFMHAWFEDIHPFIDGNGRVGRLVWWNLSLLRGEEPEVIMAQEKYDYYERLERWRTDPDRRARKTRP